LGSGGLSRVAVGADEASQSLDAQSAALFEQMLPVFLHPRCLNCHARADFPRQGDDAHRHTMNVARGPDDQGVAGLRCNTCHQSGNQAASGVPGTPGWRLAPLRMAWEGLNAAQLCQALLDPQRGGMQPEKFVGHFNSALVRWAWTPGTNAQGALRTSPPISHAQFIELTRRWVASGAQCPPER
jgi:hypothetical protein